MSQKNPPELVLVSVTLSVLPSLPAGGVALDLSFGGATVAPALLDIVLLCV
jgi:hypothetical protein